MKQILNNREGFTLIEAFIAMAVLAVGILAINAMHVSSTRGNASASRLSVAGASGENIYESLLCMAYDDAVFDPDPLLNPHDVSELTGISVPASIASATWTVDEWSSSDGVDNDGDGGADRKDSDGDGIMDKNEYDENNIKLVTVTISYTDQSAKALTISFLKSRLY